MSYKLPGDSTKLWTPLYSFLWPNGDAPAWVHPSNEFPQEMLDFIDSGGTLEAHNAGFERAIWRHVMMKKYGIPACTHWRDTLAACAYRSLPLDLDKAGRVLGLTNQKDKRGKMLIQKLCKPQKATKKKPGGRCFERALLLEMFDYCVQDTNTEHELGEKIGPLPLSEYRVWILDQKINDRGVYVDQPLVAAAVRIVEEVEKRLQIELREITDGRVEKASQLPALKDWLSDQNYTVSDLSADTIEEMLEADKSGPEHRMPYKVKRALQIRQILSKASTKKLYKYLSCAASDGKIHGLLQYHGAGTGRWAGRLLQPQNFPRGDENMLTPAANAKGVDGMSTLVEMIATGDAELLELIYGDPLLAIASALRGMIIAEEDDEMFVADFSAIEARVTAWIAGETWKINAFEAFDRGELFEGSADMYCATASMIFGKTITNKKEFPTERQAGKVCELALGYQGSVHAWRKFDDSDFWTDDQVLAHVRQWRKKHPMIVRFWYAIEDAAIKAILTGKPQSYRGIQFEIINDEAGKWLACRLPNGRRLWYYNPHLVDGGENNFGEQKWILCYEGRNNKKGGAWTIINTYGGMLTENIVQAISRDLMVEGMIRVEAAGYQIILTVHDELVARRKKGAGNKDEFVRLMTIVPEWFEGFPLHAEGGVMTRYRK